MSAVVKDWFYRITHNCKKWEMVLWWIFRAIMLYGLIESFVHAHKYEDKIRTMMIVNLACCFGWELFQAFPKTHLFRYLPSYLQNFTSVYVFLTAFMGAFVNWYYEVWWWDKSLHLVSGGLLVMVGYVMLKAYEERDGRKVPATVIVFASFCASFMFGTFWECFEFTFDQLFGGDTQHWSYALAEEANNLTLIFQPAKELHSQDWFARFALIDTMTDIVSNSVGAVVCGIILKLALLKQEKAERASKKETASVK